MSVPSEHLNQTVQRPKNPQTEAGDVPTSRQLREFDEASLLEQAQGGDHEAFEHLVNMHLGEVFRLALMMLNRRNLAEDVAGETFIGVWRNKQYLGTPGQLRVWLFRYCISRCLDLAKVHRRRGRIAQGGSPLGTEEVAALLQGIVPEQRACWLLLEVHGLPVLQIAQILALDETAVSERIAQAREGLARQWPVIDSELEAVTSGAAATGKPLPEPPVWNGLPETNGKVEPTIGQAHP